MDERAENIYLDSLTELATGTGRVWLISTADQPDEFAPLPSGWQKISEVTAGDVRARLFVIADVVQRIQGGQHPQPTANERASRSTLR